MAEIQATLTAAALELLGRYLVGDVSGTNPFEVDEFQVGEGGWEITAGGQVPKTPNPALTALAATGDEATFTKALTPGVDTDLTVTSTLVTFTANCTLAMGEFNDDGNGDFPEIFEIGLFGPHPITTANFMIAYGTFAKQTKTPAASIPNVVKVQFRLG